MEQVSKKALLEDLNKLTTFFNRIPFSLQGPELTPLANVKRRLNYLKEQSRLDTLADEGVLNTLSLVLKAKADYKKLYLQEMLYRAEKLKLFDDNVFNGLLSKQGESK